MASSFSHLDESGKARMVDVGEKEMTRREAEAGALVRMSAACLAAIRGGGVPKGDVLAVARIAGIQAAKRTAELLPLCHPVPIDAVEVRFEIDDAEPAVRITATARAHWRTGVEMEALTAATVAALALYDMCKAIDRGMSIDSVRLLRKSGGRSGDFRRA
jgi:cyclic pyranopterin phosphate synthase